MRNEVWVVMTEAPGPDSQFVEVEDVDGVGYGDFVWREWSNSHWAIGPFTHGSAAQRIEELEGEDLQALNWALGQEYQSVAARCARTLARYIQRQQAAFSPDTGEGKIR